MYFVEKTGILLSIRGILATLIQPITNVLLLCEEVPWAKRAQPYETCEDSD